MGGISIKGDAQDLARTFYLKIIFFLLIITLFLNMPAFGQGCKAELKIFKIKHSQIETIYEIANMLKSPEGSATYDSRTNKLIVLDCPENIKNIQTAIGDVDVEERQVKVDVLVVETTEQTLEKIGVSSGNVIIPQGKFSVIAELLGKEKDTSTRSQMTVRTISGSPASLQVLRDEILGVETVFNGEYVISKPVRVPRGNILEVLPVVSDDNSIKVSVRSSSSSLEKPGIPSEKELITSVVVNDGDTIAIGGADLSKSEREGSIAYGKDKAETKKTVMFLTVKISD